MKEPGNERKRSSKREREHAAFLSVRDRCAPQLFYWPVLISAVSSCDLTLNILPPQHRLRAEKCEVKEN